MRFAALWKTRWFKALLGLILLCAGIAIGWRLSFLQKPISVVPVRNPSSGYSYINPILYTVIPESLSYPTYDSLQNALASDVKAAEANKQAGYVAVYFQDLNSAEWVGINETDKFDPASMLKVAVLISLLRASEMNPSTLSSNIAIPASENLANGSDQAYFPSTDPITSGNTYTVQDLMNRMIVQSDDGADEVLVNYLGNTALSNVFTELHIPLPGSSTGVSPQEYSHLFRVLYNSSYLSPADSNTALKLLSETTFTQGLVAGVPAGTVVAHKFGESLSPPISAGATWPAAPSSTDVPGLSDCGIVYYPGHPYFLCIMTQGSSFPALAGVISGISRTTWSQVNSLYTTSSK